MEQKEKFKNQLEQIVSQKNKNNIYLNQYQYEKILLEVKAAKLKEKNKSDVDYRRLKRYDIIVVGKEEKLISPLKAGGSIKYFATIEETYGIIHDAHLATGHGGRNRLVKEINNKYNNITTEAVMLYLSLCEACQKKAKSKKKGIVIKPILTSEMNSRCQVDLIDLQTQPDNEFKFILNYQDHLTKFVVLRPLKTKTASEVAKQLMDIFTLLGAPSILQCDNGREFANRIIQELANMWDGVKIIHGKPRHSQSQGSIERANQDVQNMLTSWLITNQTTKWSEGLKYVQLMKNRAFHEGIKQTPYEALFGTRMKLGLKTSNLPMESVEQLETEEELEQLLEGVHTANSAHSKVAENDEF